MGETVGHSHAVVYKDTPDSRMRDFLASESQKRRAAAFLEIMAALEHGLTVESSKLLHKRFRHLAGE